MRWMIGLLAATVIGYLLVANALLMTSLGPKLASSPHTRVSWASGYSVVPFRIHLRDATAHVRGKQAAWQIESAHLDATISPLALLRGRLHASSARAADVTISGEDVALVPEGAPPAHRAGGPPPISLLRRGASPDPEPRDRAPAVRVDDLVVDPIREVRAGAITYRGAASARGSLSVFDDAPIRIEHATVSARNGELDIGTTPMLRAVRGNVALEAHEIDTNAPPLRAWLGGVDATMDMEATLTLDAVAATGASAEGTLRTHLRVDGGALAPGSTVALRVPAATEQASGPSFSADLGLEIAGDGHATLGGELHELAWPRQNGDRAPIAIASTVRIEGQSPRVRMAALLENASGTVDASGVRIDASRLPIVRSLVRAAPEALRGEARLSIEHEVVSGTATAHADTADLTLADHVVPGSLDVGAELHGWRVGTPDARVHVRATHAAPGAGPTASVELKDATLHLAAPASIDALAQVETSSSEAVLDAITGKAALPPVVAAIASTQRLEASAVLHADAQRARLEHIQASAGLLSARGTFTNQGDGDTATLLLEAGPLAVGVSVDRGQTTLVFADSRAWFDAKLAAEASRPPPP